MSNEPVAPHPAPASLPTSMLFIDGTNLDRVCLEKFGRNEIDFEKLLPEISKGTQLLHTYYVTAPYKRDFDENRYRVQTGMLNHLRRIPNVTVDLQQHRMRENWCKFCRRSTMVPREKGTDVSVGAFLVEQAVLKAADQMILVANDTDYGPAFKVAKRHARRTVLAYVLGNDEKEHQIKLNLAPIWNESNRIVRMDLTFFEQCWMRKRT